MKINNVLRRIEKEELTAQEALELLYPDIPVTPSKYGKRAMFVKFNIVVPEEGKGLNTFLKILFCLPIPIMFARIGIRIASRFVDTEEFDIKEIGKMLKYSKNTRIKVESKEALINIRVI